MFKIIFLVFAYSAIPDSPHSNIKTCALKIKKQEKTAADATTTTKYNKNCQQNFKEQVIFKRQHLKNTVMYSFYFPGTRKKYFCAQNYT